MTRRLIRTLCLLVLAARCGSSELDIEADESEPIDDLASTAEQGLVSCAGHTDTGYSNGTPFLIHVVSADGKPVEIGTANAYAVMQQAAAGAGVQLRVVSGFRTMAEQQYLYNCYLTGSCNGGNLAARPGYSNHQSGHALDLNTSTGGVANWLANNGGRFGFRRTVPSEAWHFEWWGGGPGGGPCGGGGGEPVGADGCTSTQRNNCGGYGCGCVNGQCSGGACPGSGCTSTATNNCAAYGCGCVDGQCSGGACGGSGCTALQTNNCSAYGCGCANGQCSGGACGGSGCTTVQTNNCAAYGCGCSLGQCKGGACPP